MEAIRTIAKRNDVPVPCQRLKIASYDSIDDELLNKTVLQKYFIYQRRFLRGYSSLFSRKMWKRTVAIWLLMGLEYGFYSAVVIFDSDVLGEDDATSTCTFNYDLNTFVASAEFLGPMLVAPIIDKPNLGVWGGRFAAQWVSMVACACACYFLADSTGISKYIYAFIARGTIVGAAGTTGIAITEWYPTVNRGTATCAVTMVGTVGAMFGASLGYASISDQAKALALCVSAAVAILPILVLPETAGIPLPDTFEDDLSIGLDCKRVNCCGKDEQDFDEVRR